MKLNKYSIIAFGLSAAMLFAGCAFEGTKTSFKKNENNAYNAEYDSVKIPGYVFIKDDTITKATDSKLRFVIVSNGYLNEDTIEKGCNFYSVAENNVPEFMSVLGTAPVTKTLKDLTVVIKESNKFSKSYDGWDIDFTSTPYTNKKVCLTFVTYEVDTTQFSTNKVALVADAEVLRENTKKYILNGNDNDECGEETDSLAAFYTLDSGTTINPRYTFAPSFNFGSWYYNAEHKTDKTFRYDLKIGAPEYDKNGTTVYGENFASDINSMYTLKIRPLGEKKWQSVDVNVILDPLDHTYKWQSEPLATGTQYYLLYEPDFSLTWDAMSEYYGIGIAPRLSYYEDRQEILDKGVSYYYTTEPTYIITDPTVQTPFTEGYYIDYSSGSASEIKAVQSAIVNVAYLNDGIIKISINGSYKTAGIRFGTIKDFAITTKKTRSDDGVTCCGAELDFDLLEDKTISDTTGITDVFLQLDNKYFDMNNGANVMVWAGPGVTISGSKTAQTTFGCLGAEVDELYLAMPGYVCIN